MTGRIQGIDGVRAIAALIVFAHHAGIPWLQGGNIGVDIFFVISGFVITRTLLSEIERSGRIDVLSFYGRRFTRLVPALLVMVLFLTWLLWPVFSWRLEIMPALLYFSNWTRALGYGYPGILGHTWTLSIEEQFYIVIPLAFAVFKPRSIRTAVLFLILGLLSASLRHFIFFETQDALQAINRTDTHCDALFFGVALAYLTAYHIKSNPLLVFIGASFLIYCCVCTNVYGPWMVKWGFLGVAISSLMVIWYIHDNQDGQLVKVLSWKPLAGLGVISYGFYLWHYPMLILLHNYTPKPFVNGLLAFAATLTFATLSWYLVERPLKNMGRSKILKTDSEDYSGIIRSEGVH